MLDLCMRAAWEKLTHLIRDVKNEANARQTEDSVLTPLGLTQYRALSGLNMITMHCNHRIRGELSA